MRNSVPSSMRIIKFMRILQFISNVKFKSLVSLFAYIDVCQKRVISGCSNEFAAATVIARMREILHMHWMNYKTI